MARFQAQIDPITEGELEFLRKRLGLPQNQKAHLLREVAALASWCVRLADAGERSLPVSSNPVLEGLSPPRQDPRRLTLSMEEATKLQEILDAPFAPPPGLERALASLLSAQRRPPSILWNE